MQINELTQKALLNVIKDASFNHQELWYVKIGDEVIAVNGLTYFKTKGAAKTAITNLLNDYIFSINQKSDTPLKQRNPNLDIIANAGIVMKDYTDNKVPKDVTRCLFENKLIEIIQFLKCD